MASGTVEAEKFAWLSEGQHPNTGDQLVRHRTGQQYTNDDGKIVKPVEHRAGWDATFSAPKSVSLTALNAFSVSTTFTWSPMRWSKRRGTVS
jgi:hypothetical protein